MTTPRIALCTTYRFEKVWTDAGSGADRDGAFYRPVPPEGFFLLGDYAQPDHDEPDGYVFTIRVELDDRGFPALAEPEGFEKIYDDTGTGADQDGSIWQPVPPEGYVPLGHVASSSHEVPDVPLLRCLREDMVFDLPLGELIWSDAGSGGKYDVSVYRVPVLGTIFALPEAYQERDEDDEDEPVAPIPTAIAV